MTQQERYTLIERIAVAWLHHQGYSDEQLAFPEHPDDEMDHATHERLTGWERTDG